MDFYSPLRYPGGKGKVANFIKSIFEENLLLDGCYVEPYAGGASVALSLLIDEYASSVIINDFDRSIFAFWHCVLNDTENFCRTIKNTPVNMDVWQRQRGIQKKKITANLDELGFSTFFLNRTNRSGIIKAGVIGGNNQEGNFKIDARYNKDNLISRIERIAKYSDRIQLYNLDACDLINQVSANLPQNTLYYFDPPYYVKGKDLYVNHYQHEDHEKVAKMIGTLNEKKWVVSYDNASKIKEMYSQFNMFEYSLNYSAVNSTKGAEVIIFSDTVYMPETILLSEVVFE